MCCRYVLLETHAKSLLDKLGVLLETGSAALASRYNIPPGAPIITVRNKTAAAPATSTAAASPPARELTALHWGLTPGWARSANAPVTNARAETLADKPTFRDAARFRRCLIPASGFYEWKRHGHAREPWLFRLRDEQPFALAGIWETWRAPDGTAHESCAVVTTAPNSLMEPIHHRMPAILASPADWNLWLDPRIDSTDTLTPLLAPFPATAMTAFAVTPRVNSTRAEGPACLAPATELQLGLFS